MIAELVTSKTHVQVWLNHFRTINPYDLKLIFYPANYLQRQNCSQTQDVMRVLQNKLSERRTVRYCSHGRIWLFPCKGMVKMGTTPEDTSLFCMIWPSIPQRLIRKNGKLFAFTIQPLLAIWSSFTFFLRLFDS